ncbi:MAG: VCBS repeat-containing protein, partial [Balneolaceae bacterium]
MSHRYTTYLILLACLLLQSCSTDQKNPLFSKLDPSHTGIDFANTITTSDSVHAENNSFIYNGAGVATGDINNDGLVDIFFTGNMESSKLYLNRGNMEFENITELAGVSTSHWATGVSLVDINQDGFLDIYVSISASKDIGPEKRRNLLFINNGAVDGQVPTFTEAAAEYGIDDTSFTTHAAFLDYDLDGDLDLFLLNNSPEEFSRGETGQLPTGVQNETSPSGFDKLYRNNGDGTFTNVSEEAGILKKLGYGLGVAVDDLNGDGWPDIYISNDITPNDVLYINNKDGTFTDRAADFLNHTSFAGMGIDIADFTNNGWPDIIQTDMLPEELSGQKAMSGSTTYGGFRDLRRQGFFPHYNINTLQMNHGVTNDGEVIFSEIGRMAGVAATHWSWTSLFADFDNSGFKDLLITNGYPKALNDFDYLSDLHTAGRGGNRETIGQRKQQILDELHTYKIPNYLFRNNGDLTFTDQSEAWGMNEP